MGPTKKLKLASGMQIGIYTLLDKLPSVRKPSSSNYRHTLSLWKVKCECGEIAVKTYKNISRNTECLHRRKEKIASKYINTPYQDLNAVDEIWKEIPGYEGVYDVSNMGRVRSWHSKKLLMTDKPIILNPWLRRNRDPGYFCVTLHKNKFCFKEAVHRLVLLAFIGECPVKGWHGAHLNGNSLDNRLENLKWVTPQENSEHKILHGTVSRGSKNGNARTTEADVLEIRRLYAKGWRIVDLQKKYGFKGNSGIFKIVHGQGWDHV